MVAIAIAPVRRHNPKLHGSPLSGLIIDNFAGGGGASLGLKRAFGRDPHLAVNHDPHAIRMHEYNHRDTKHMCESVWDVDPVAACGGNEVDAAWFSPDCFPAGTMILTSSGYRPIEEIKIGDSVLTHKGRFRTVTDTKTARKKTMTVCGHGHYGIETTYEHPFYIRHRSEYYLDKERPNVTNYSRPEWIPASILTKKSYWAKPLSFPKLAIPHINNIAIDSAFMWLVGRYLADGWSRLNDKHAELVICCGPRKEIRTEDSLSHTCLRFTKRRTKTEFQFTLSDKTIVKWLRTNFGHLAQNKFVPAWALGMEKDLRLSLLRGYLSGDGYTSGNKVECSTVSKRLALGISSLVSSLGFSPTMYFNPANTTKIEGRDVSVRPIYMIRWRETTAKEHRQTKRDDRHEWSPIRWTRQHGTVRTVYNITVADDESYVADGVVVHNCKHFSRAKGAKPVDKNIRGLAWIVVRWAEKVRPKVIFLENVREFKDWGPLIQLTNARGRLLYDDEGNPIMVPDKTRKGLTFKRWLGRLRNLGYHVEWKELNAADYGVPTHRRRLFLIARCDGNPIVWPEATHGPGRLPYRTAAEIIDWTIPCKSIFDRKKPLAEKTLRRIANGLRRFVIEAKEPFIVGLRGPTGSLEPRSTDKPLDTIMPGKTKHVIIPELEPVTVPFIAGVGGRQAQTPPLSVNHTLSTVTSKNDKVVIVPSLMQVNHGGHDYRNQPVTQPVNTITAEKSHAVMAASLVKVNHGRDENRSASVDAPLSTITGKNGDAVMAATLIQTGYGERPGQAPRVPGIDKPLGTVVGTTKHAVVAAYMARIGQQGSNGIMAHGVDRPIGTVVSKNEQLLVTAHLAQHYTGMTGKPLEVPLPTVTAIDHNALVTTFLTKFYGTSKDGQPVTLPAPTVTADGQHVGVVAPYLIRYNTETSEGTVRGQRMDEPVNTVVSANRFAQVQAFLVKYYGECNNGQSLNEPLHTATAKPRFGLVTIHGIDYQIVDIGMRMLTPRELFRAQGFPDTYKIDIGSKAQQVARCGNSVPPRMAEILARANVPNLVQKKRVA